MNLSLYFLPLTLRYMFHWSSQDAFEVKKLKLKTHQLDFTSFKPWQLQNERMSFLVYTFLSLCHTKGKIIPFKHPKVSKINKNFASRQLTYFKDEHELEFLFTIFTCTLAVNSHIIFLKICSNGTKTRVSL